MVGVTPGGRHWRSLRTVLNPSGADLSRIEQIEFFVQVRATGAISCDAIRRSCWTSARSARTASRSRRRRSPSRRRCARDCVPTRRIKASASSATIDSIRNAIRSRERSMRWRTIEDFRATSPTRSWSSTARCPCQQRPRETASDSVHRPSASCRRSATAARTARSATTGSTKRTSMPTVRSTPTRSRSSASSST